MDFTMQIKKYIHFCFIWFILVNDILVNDI